MKYRLREPFPNSQVYWACTIDTETAGVLGVRIGGVDYTGDTLNAANGYTGTVTAVVGSYQMLMDGVPVSGATGVCPAYPTGDYDILFMADSQPFDNLASFDKIEAKEPNSFLVITQEMHYLDQNEGGGVVWPIANSWPDKDLTTVGNEATYNSYLNGDGSNIGLREKYLTLSALHTDRAPFFAKRPTLAMADNHELMHGTMGGTPAPGKVAFDATWRAAYEQHFMGWTAPTGDVDVVPDTIHYRSKEIGNLKIILCDQHGYLREGQELDDGNADPVAVTRQVFWIRDEINNATTDFIMLVFGTPITFSMGSFVGDDATALAQFIEASSKSIFAVVGDSHVAWARMINEDLPTRPMLDIGCSPCSPTNATSHFIAFSDDLYFFDKMHHGPILTAEYDPAAAPPADVTLTVDDTSMVTDELADGKQRIYGTSSNHQSTVASIDSATQLTLNTPLGGGVRAIGAQLSFHPIETTARVSANANDRNIQYLKMRVGSQMRFTMKTVFDADGDDIVWDYILKAGERTPRPAMKVALAND